MQELAPIAAAPVLDEETEAVPEEPAHSDEDLAAERRTILERLSRHELSADEAAAAIRALGRS